MSTLKNKYELEFEINSSPHVLYEYISTPSGLLEWFSDDVISKGDHLTFVWGTDEEDATLIAKSKDKSVRFKWDSDEEKSYYFEMKIQVDDLTKDVSLIVTDFSEPDELEEAKMYWNNLIDNLRHVLGAV